MHLLNNITQLLTFNTYPLVVGLTLQNCSKDCHKQCTIVIQWTIRRNAETNMFSKHIFTKIPRINSKCSFNNSYRVREVDHVQAWMWTWTQGHWLLSNPALNPLVQMTLNSNDLPESGVPLCQIQEFHWFKFLGSLGYPTSQQSSKKWPDSGRLARISPCV